MVVGRVTWNETKIASDERMSVYKWGAREPSECTEKDEVGEPEDTMRRMARHYKYQGLGKETDQRRVCNRIFDE